jgi:uncharacterized protein YcfL
MKTHILFATLTALLLTACASHEGRKVSSTQDPVKDELEYSKRESNTGRDYSRQ